MTSLTYNFAYTTSPAMIEPPRPRPVAVTAQEVQEFIDQVRGPDLCQFEKYVRSFEFNARQLADIANIASKRINRPEVWLPHVALVSDTFHGKPIFRVRLQFRADAVRRILSVCTDPCESSFVIGPPRDCPERLPVLLHEDPSVLFRHISRLFFLPLIPLPPPLTAA